MKVPDLRNFGSSHFSRLNTPISLGKLFDLSPGDFGASGHFRESLIQSARKRLPAGGGFREGRS